MVDLLRRSIEIILGNQERSGAYPACPSFPTYRYCWFRDGAFTAYAMDLVGEFESAARFHNWAAETVLQKAGRVGRAVTKARRGSPPGKEDILHTRYTIDGTEANEEWPNFQLDGLGTWMWALNEHCSLSGTPPRENWRAAARLVGEYLSALWRFPCFDCWEEFPDRVHPHTLAAIIGGLRAHSALDDIDLSSTLSTIESFLHSRAVRRGFFVKSIGSQDVDASLIALATPYRVVDPNDPVMRRTVEQVEATLRWGGGVHRYAQDTYYGGGEWVLLTAWLGWYYLQAGARDKAEEALGWVEAQCDEAGQFPEQVPVNLNDEAYYEPWRERWGAIAKPLLWSHAKYIILVTALRG
jgi:GH15 family glucan-1,4-alpha-glucosidase